MYKVKYRTCYSTFDEPEDQVLFSEGTLYVEADNIRSAYDCAIKKLTNFCGDYVDITSIVDDYKPELQ